MFFYYVLQKQIVPQLLELIAHNKSLANMVNLRELTSSKVTMKGKIGDTTNRLKISEADIITVN